MVATIVRETIWQEQTTPIDKGEEVITLMEGALAREPKTQSSKGATFSCWMKKSMTNPWRPPPKKGILHEVLFSDEILTEEFPPRIRPLHVHEYNGTLNLEEHLGHFKNLTLLH